MVWQQFCLLNMMMGSLDMNLVYMENLKDMACLVSELVRQGVSFEVRPSGKHRSYVIELRGY